MIKKVFEAQVKNRTKKDWISTVLKDMEQLGVNASFADIQQMSKGEWKTTIKRSIEKKAFQNLMAIKQTHSKVEKLVYEKIEMQSYFLPNKIDCSKEDIQLIFKIRSKMTNVKMNRKKLFKTHECSVCLDENETQEHIYTCDEIWEKRGKIKENIPKYEQIMTGNRKEKILVANIFKENLRILEQHQNQNSKIK